jgi:hypothetical protein
MVVHVAQLKQADRASFPQRSRLSWCLMAHSGGRLHELAHHIEDLSSLLRALTAEDALTATPAHADLIKRDTPDRFRHPRDGDALVRMLKRRPDPGSEAHIEVMPRGRNFH